MNCPHCGKYIASKAKVRKLKFDLDRKRAIAAIEVLNRVSIPELRDAAQHEALRLAHAIENPELLYRIYRRTDKDGGYNK